MCQIFCHFSVIVTNTVIQTLLFLIVRYARNQYSKWLYCNYRDGADQSYVHICDGPSRLGLPSRLHRSRSRVYRIISFVVQLPCKIYLYSHLKVLFVFEIVSMYLDMNHIVYIFHHLNCLLQLRIIWDNSKTRHQYSLKLKRDQMIRTRFRIKKYIEICMYTK